MSSIPKMFWRLIFVATFVKLLSAMGYLAQRFLPLMLLSLFFAFIVMIGLGRIKDEDVCLGSKIIRLLSFFVIMVLLIIAGVFILPMIFETSSLIPVLVVFAYCGAVLGWSEVLYDVLSAAFQEWHDRQQG